MREETEGMSQTQTTTLTEFLLARIAEDEATARAAEPGPWHVDDERYAESIRTADGVAVVAGGRWGDEASVFESTEDAVHIARHDPARVLAECEAKRRIVEWCGERHQIYIGTWGQDPEAARPSDFVPGDFVNPADSVVLRDLALPYADHPDYREEWRPNLGEQ